MSGLCEDGVVVGLSVPRVEQRTVSNLTLPLGGNVGLTEPSGKFLPLGPLSRSIWPCVHWIAALKIADGIIVRFSVYSLSLFLL